MACPQPPHITSWREVPLRLRSDTVAAAQIDRPIDYSRRTAYIHGRSHCTRAQGEAVANGLGGGARVC